MCEEMYLSGDFEYHLESLKSTKLTPFIIGISVRGEILLILLGALKWVLLYGIWPKGTKWKLKIYLFSDILSKYNQNYHRYYLKNGVEKSSTTYVLFINALRLIYDIVSVSKKIFSFCIFVHRNFFFKFSYNLPVHP